MREEAADSLQELVRLALDVAGPGAGDVELWFRGQGRSSWSLRPSLYRRQPDVAHALRVEEMLFLDFNNRSRMVAERANARGDWELSFLMQHHRLPTRLLDWSRNLLIGAYFAVSDREAWEEPDDPPCVFIFKPRDWNAKTVGEGGVAAAGPSGVISELTEGIAAGYGPSGPMSRGSAQQYALAIAGPEFATRIAAQRGVFTVFGTRAPEGSQSLEEQEPLLQPGAQTLRKVRLSGDRRAWEDALRLVGIGEFAAFPDLDGLARELDAQYFPKDKQLPQGDDEESGLCEGQHENDWHGKPQPEGENGDAGR
jgi:FRG domain